MSQARLQVATTEKVKAAAGELTTSAATALYTAPANGGGELLFCQFSNLDGSNAVDVTLALVPSGSSYSAGAYDVMTAKTLAAKGVDNTSINGIPLAAGTAVHGLASANGDARYFMWVERDRSSHSAY